MEGGKPTIITNAEGGRTTPSVVAFTKTGDRLVGQVSICQKHILFWLQHAWMLRTAHAEGMVPPPVRVRGPHPGGLGPHRARCGVALQLICHKIAASCVAQCPGPLRGVWLQRAAHAPHVCRPHASFSPSHAALLPPPCPTQIAKRQAVVNPENTFYSVKRFIGRRMSEVGEEAKQVPYTVSG